MSSSLRTPKLDTPNLANTLTGYRTRHPSTGHTEGLDIGRKGGGGEGGGSVLEGDGVGELEQTNKAGGPINISILGLGFRWFPACNLHSALRAATPRQDTR